MGIRFSVSFEGDIESHKFREGTGRIDGVRRKEIFLFPLYTEQNLTMRQMRKVLPSEKALKMTKEPCKIP